MIDPYLWIMVHGGIEGSDGDVWSGDDRLWPMTLAALRVLRAEIRDYDLPDTRGGLPCDRESILRRVSHLLRLGADGREDQDAINAVRDALKEVYTTPATLATTMSDAVDAVLHFFLAHHDSARGPSLRRSLVGWVRDAVDRDPDLDVAMFDSLLAYELGRLPEFEAVQLCADEAKLYGEALGDGPQAR